MKLQQATVRIRRDTGQQVKPEAEEIDGRTYAFRHLWDFGPEDDRYPNEAAWAAWDDNYPEEAPVWIASGDLEFAS